MSATWARACIDAGAARLRQHFLSNPLRVLASAAVASKADARAPLRVDTKWGCASAVLDASSLKLCRDEHLSNSKSWAKA